MPALLILAGIVCTAPVSMLDALLVLLSWRNSGLG